MSRSRSPISRSTGGRLLPDVAGPRAGARPGRGRPAGHRRAATARCDAGRREKVCRSPIFGIVVRVTVQVGQHIQVGDGVLVLEAMKMETDITAPVAGRSRRDHVNVGDSVKGGQVLVEFE